MLCRGESISERRMSMLRGTASTFKARWDMRWEVTIILRQPQRILTECPSIVSERQKVEKLVSATWSTLLMECLLTFACGSAGMLRGTRGWQREQRGTSTTYTLVPSVPELGCCSVKGDAECEGSNEHSRDEDTIPSEESVVQGGRKLFA